MRELLRNFQSNCIAIGPDRNVLLRKLVAAGIAYAVPVPCGEGDQYRVAYEKMAMIPAMKVISEVNEVMLLGNTDEVLNDVRTLWETRYKILNTPLVTDKIYDHMELLRPPANDLVETYNHWVRDFQDASVRVISRGV